MDRELIHTKRRDDTRLGFALQVCTVRFLGTFLTNPLDVPEVCITYVARQLGIIDLSSLTDYTKRTATHIDHAEQIREFYGYSNFSDQPGHFQLVRWLYTRAWLSAERPTVLFDMATAWLLDHKILLPGPTILERLVARVRRRVARRLYRMLSQLPNAQQRLHLELLLTKYEGQRTTILDQLRQSPTRVSGPGLIGALRRLETIRAIDLRSLDLSRIPSSRIRTLAQYAQIARAQTVARMQEERKIATLMAFAYELEATAQDEALDLLDQLINGLFENAVKTGEKERLRTLRDLDSAARHLRDACQIVLNPAFSGEAIRQRIFQQVSPEMLARAVQLVSELTRSPDTDYYERLEARYRSVRRYLPTLLRTITFDGLPVSEPTRSAWDFLCRREGIDGPPPDLQEAPRDIITRKWQSLVIDETNDINLQFYTFCCLRKLQDGLYRRDIFVSPSYRWHDPRAKLLQGQAWIDARPQVCRVLNRSTDAAHEVQALADQLDNAYRRTLENFSENADVSIESDDKGRDRLKLSNLDKLDEPESLVQLRSLVKASLPHVDLPDILLEIHQMTGFADEFVHASEAQSRMEDLPISVCAVLLAEACNIPLKPLIRPDVPALTRDRLLWVQQNYIRAETLIAANARLVDAQATIPLAQAWGGGEVASADGIRFTVPVRTIHAGRSVKHFGAGRGVTFINFTSDQFTGFHNIVVPGAVREALYILDGLLEQQSNINPTELMTDTAGYTDVIFGLFWLLGYQFSPRLASVGKTRFWRIDRQADYGVFDAIARHRIRTDLVVENWDDLLRAAGSLKFGLLSASELMRTLRSGSRESVLTKSIKELGRIAKTLYLLAYIDDETYRRRVLTQLNRGEDRQGLAKAILHGQLGQIRKHYRVGQENQLGALGLVTNVVVLWNTLYLDSALNNLQAMGVEVHPENLPRLWPLSFEHINFLGRYDFTLHEAVRNGQMRPLRDPFAVDDLSE